MKLLCINKKYDPSDRYGLIVGNVYDIDDDIQFYFTYYTFIINGKRINLNATMFKEITLDEFREIKLKELGIV